MLGDKRVARRQQALLLRSAELRGVLAQQSVVLQRPLALADQARDGWHWLRAHPEWPIGAAALLVLLRPRHVMRWGFRLWFGWRRWQQMQRWLART